jgi:hypothetical protein
MAARTGSRASAAERAGLASLVDSQEVTRDVICGREVIRGAEDARGWPDHPP